MLSTDLLLIVHDLLNQIFVDLTQSTVEHLATFEHVENSIRENRLVMTDSIYVKDKFT